MDDCSLIESIEFSGLSGVIQPLVGTVLSGIGLRYREASGMAVASFNVGNREAFRHGRYRVFPWETGPRYWNVFASDPARNYSAKRFQGYDDWRRRHKARNRRPSIF